MRHQPDGITDGGPDPSDEAPVARKDYNRRLSLGPGFGDRFGASQGSSGSFKERVLLTEKPTELQGKAFQQALL